MCVDHVGAGEFTIHFSPGDRGLHLPSLAKKVNAPLMPEGGGGGGGEAGVSNDWCIRRKIFINKASKVSGTRLGLECEVCHAILDP